MLAPSSNWISMYLPKRELLSFLVVLALPKASMIGLVAIMQDDEHHMSLPPFAPHPVITLTQNLFFNLCHSATTGFLLFANRFLIISSCKVTHDILGAHGFASTTMRWGERERINQYVQTLTSVFTYLSPETTIV